MSVADAESRGNELDFVSEEFGATLTMDGSLCSDLSSLSEIEPRDYRGGDVTSCEPLSTLDEIWQWRRQSWSSVVTGLSPRTTMVVPGGKLHCAEGVLPRLHKDSVPKTLFCHDLKGGYHQDKFVSGSHIHDEYRFFHWTGIDTFVYFSHHLLTVPPASWINSGHLHGVLVLGTLITEGQEGARVWERILVDLPTVTRFADTLAAICRHFRFDGYLLNIENEIPEKDIPLLIRFVSELRGSLHRMGLKQAQIIWYDSVTLKGKLEWQNQLNSLNRCFFDICDGIFLNYTWTKKHLKNSLKVAGARCLDVYVGVDVFGRNCYGGGGFDSDKAVSLIRSTGLSVALFAASWTHEYFNGRNFLYLEHLFWQKLWPYLYIHGPMKLPFSTSFCQGYGKNIFKNGMLFSDGPWYNLRHQRYQPCISSCLEQSKVNGGHVKNPTPSRAESESSNATATNLADNEQPCDTKETLPDLSLSGQGYVAHHNEDAFYGGSCLKIGGPGNYSMDRMLICGFRSSGIVVISVASKVSSTSVVPLPVLKIKLLVQEREGRYCKHILLGAEQGAEEAYQQECAVHLHRPLTPGELVQVRSAAMDQCAQKQLSVEGSNGWDVRHFSVEIYGVIIEVGAAVSNQHDVMYLGWLALSRLDGY